MITSLIERYPNLVDCQESIQSAFDILCHCFKSGNKVLLCGNGGSAADAEHISAELLKSFGKKRPLKGHWVEKLGQELASSLEGALPAIPLSSFTSFSTAYSNDRSATYGFAQLTFALGAPGDVLWAISTSGNSKNVLEALKVAQAKGMHTLGVSGKTGGALKALCECSILVPETETYKIQELHLPIYHTLCLMLEETLF